MDQLTIAITEMDNMTQQNAALVEETASASEEMANQAQELMTLTQQFKTGNGNGKHLETKAIHLKSLEHHTPAERLKTGTKGNINPGNGGGKTGMKKGDGFAPMKHGSVGVTDKLREEGFEEF